MADYPSIAFAVQGGGEDWNDARLVSRSRAGGVKVRLLGAAKKRVFMVSHRGLRDADRLTYQTFYDANRALSFNFTFKAVVYVVVFGDSSLRWSPIEPGLWALTVTLLEV